MWLFLGLLLGVGVTLLAMWLRSRGVAVSWYEWGLALLGLALILFAYQNYRTSIIEYETVAAGYLLLIFGLPGLVLLALAVFLVWWRQYRRTKTVKTRAKVASQAAG